jgi:hypothetical protein
MRARHSARQLVQRSASRFEEMSSSSRQPR